MNEWMARNVHRQKDIQTDRQRKRERRRKTGTSSYDNFVFGLFLLCFFVCLCAPPCLLKPLLKFGLCNNCAYDNNVWVARPRLLCLVTHMHNNFEERERERERERDSLVMFEKALAH